MCFYYLFFLLRTTNAIPATAIKAIPTTTNIVVPIPPVAGKSLLRAFNNVIWKSSSKTGVSIFFPSSSFAVFPPVTVMYPFAASTAGVYVNVESTTFNSVEPALTGTFVSVIVKSNEKFGTAYSVLGASVSINL